MSYLAFITESHGEVLLRGAERAHMNVLVGDLAKAVIPHEDTRVLRAMMPRIRPSFEELGYGRAGLNRSLLGAYMLHGEDELFQVDGQPVDNFCLTLNTAIALGSDSICLAARLHAQCEIHAYVEGPNRAWLADLIQQSLDLGIFREGMRWDEVQELLRADDTSPVVTYSSSTGESFPNANVANWTPPVVEGEADWDAWYDLLAADQWRLAMPGLRLKSAKDELELRPDQLRAVFGHGKSLFDVFKEKR
jgi:hypothetical protein